MRKALLTVILTLVAVCCAGCSSATRAADAATITPLIKMDMDHMLRDEAADTTTLFCGEGWYLLRIGDKGYYIDVMDIPGYINQATEIYSGPSNDYLSIGTLDKYAEIDVVGLCINTLYYCIQWEDEDGICEGYIYYRYVSDFSSGILRIS